MSRVSRRGFLGLTAAGAALAAGERAVAARAAAAGLASLTREAQPISAAEHGARLTRVQGLMQQQKIAAFLVEAGPSLEYFTGIRWWRSERTTAALIPADGRVVVVTPYFEEPSMRETLDVPAEVRPWKEDESPFALLAGALREHAGGPARGRADDPASSSSSGRRRRRRARRRWSRAMSSSAPAACIKSAAELALMQAANDVTIAALRYTPRPGRGGHERRRPSRR